MLEQSWTGRTYTRDAYAPLRRDAHAGVEKLAAGSTPAPLHFSNFGESVLDRSGTTYKENHPERAADCRVFLSIGIPEGLPHESGRIGIEFVYKLVTNWRSPVPSQLIVHAVFSTKHRRPFLHSAGSSDRNLGVYEEP